MRRLFLLFVAFFATYYLWAQDVIFKSGDLYYTIRQMTYAPWEIAEVCTLPNPEGYSIYYNAAYHDLTEAIIPETVEHEGRPYPVTSIGFGAFKNSTNLKSVSIPNSVTMIWDDAFNQCNALTEINIPNSVEIIGNRAFHYCQSLESLEIPEGVWQIGDEAFMGNFKLTNLKLPNSLQTIGKSALSGCGFKTITIPTGIKTLPMGLFGICMELESLVIPNNITTIESDVFVGCLGLTSIEIPNSVESLGGYAFSGCDNLETVILSEKLTVIEDGTFTNCPNIKNIYFNSTTPPSIGGSSTIDSSTPTCYIPCGTLEAYEASDWAKVASELDEQCEQIFYTSSDGKTVTVLNDINIFGANIISNTYENGLGIITFDDDVTTIGHNAFRQNNTLISIIIPNSVTSIGDNAFWNCYNLASINIPNGVKSIGSSAFKNTVLTSVTLPNSVTTIANSAFADCEYLSEIIIPDSITEIESHTFSGCKSLASVTIPNSVIHIGDYAFEYCYKLETIIIPDNVARIGWSAFDHCHLSSIIIPKSVTSIGQNAFRGSSIKSIVVEEGNTIYDSRNNCNAIIKTETNTLIVGCQNSIIPSTVTSIGSYAFHDNMSLTSISIPGNIKKIGYYSFDGCVNLSSVTISNGVTEIDDSAFSSCSFNSITLPESVVSIGNMAFQGSNNPVANIYLKSTTPPTLGGSYVFQTPPTCYIPCGTLEAYEASDWAQQVGEFVEECENVLPDSTHCIFYTSSDGNIVTPNKTDVFGANIVSNTYENGQGVIIFDGPVTTIGDYAYYNCSSLTKIVLSKYIKEIGAHAFENCYSLKTISNHDSIMSIGEYAFSGCASLMSISLANLTVIENNTFEKCTALTSIAIPNKVNYVNNYAFSGCTSLNFVAIGENVKNIGEYAFENCFSIDTIYCYSKTPPEISNTVFNNYDAILFIPCSAHNYQSNKVEWSKFAIITCVSSIYYRIINDSIAPYTVSVSERWSGSFYEYPDYEGDLVIPSAIMIEDRIYQVTSIDDYAFRFNNWAFSNSDLTSITIPTSVTHIGKSILTECNSVTSLIIEEGNPIYDTRDGCNAIIETRTNKLITGCKNTIIPNTVEIIGEYAFVNRCSPSTVIIPNSVKIISENAFSQCWSIDTLIIGDGVTTIGAGAFSNCRYLSSINIGNNVKNIEASAFYSCVDLTSIEIPESVENIGDRSFSQCTILSSVIIGNNVINIGDNAFSSCDSLTSIVIPKNVKDIGICAFNGCKSLSSIVVEVGNTTYDSRENCNAIIETKTNTLLQGCNNTIIPNSITSIGEYAFSGCDFLSIIIPENVTSINNYSFASCKSLTDIYVHATTPPLLSRVAFTYITPPTCYIPCGTLEAYEASDWAEQVGEFVEECEAEQYTRDVTPNRYGTICLPFGSTDFSGATFYEIAYKAPFMIYFDEVTKLEAGKPYIFYAHSNKLIVTSDGSRVNNPLFDNGLYGTFDEIVAAAINILTNNYIVNNNTLCLCGEYCSLSANRAYVKLDEVSSTARALSPGRKRVSMSVQGENTTTALDNISEETESITIKEGVYDILGRKMSQPAGMGFYIIDGQKVIISQ